MTSAENAKIAIYWDFENIHACLIDREYGREEYINNRYRPQPPIVQIEPVIDYAASLGDVVIHKAYCNWQFFGRYQESLNSSGMDLIQIFPRGWNAKNGADISLALDALTDTQQHSHITHVLIISNDTDFVSLAQKVKQSGRTIIGIGLPEANRFWQSSCNEFKQYDALCELAREPIASAEIPNAAVPDENSAKEAVQPPVNNLETARTVLVKCLRQIVDRYGESRIPKTSVKSFMKRLDPAFDERGLGFSNFSAFLQDFPDLVVNVDPQHIALVVIGEQSTTLPLTLDGNTPEGTEVNRTPLEDLAFEPEVQESADGENGSSPI